MYAELSEIGDLVKQLEAEREGGEETLKQKIAELEVYAHTHTHTHTHTQSTISHILFSVFRQNLKVCLKREKA